jgi:hypothetical protein
VPRNTPLEAPPSGDDPRAQAEYFMDMLNALGAQATPEAKRLRVELIETIAAYRDDPDKEHARIELAAKMMGLESAVSTILQSNIDKVRQRLTKDLKKIGATSATGKAMKAAAKGFETMSKALGKLAIASRDNDQTARSEAQALLAKARTELEGLGVKT